MSHRASMLSSPSRIAYRSLPWLLAAIPLLFLIVVVLTQTVDVPFADQWALVPLLERSFKGGVRLRDLWAQHNEHRLLVPRALMLLLARMSGWNTHVEMLANIVLAGLVCAILIAQLRRTERAIHTSLLWLVPAISLAIFSLNQAENWWGGWNIQIFLCDLAVVSSIVLLTWPERRWYTFALALLCGVLASYSYGPGLLVWIVGLLLLIQVWPWSAAAGWRIALWCGVGAVTLKLFFTDYVWSEQSTSLLAVLRAPLPYLLYSVTYLGAPPTRGFVEFLFGAMTGDTRAVCNLGDSDLCGYVNISAIIAGVAGVVLFVLLLWALWRALPRAALLPYLGLGVYALATGAMTSLGRTSYGNHQALAQRYATMATLFWVALLVLLALYAHTYVQHIWPARLSQGAVLLLCAMLLLGSLQGLDHFANQRAFLAPAREALLSMHDDALLERLYPDVNVVKKLAPVLQKYHLAVFR